MATLLRLRNAAAATGVLSLTIAAAALGAGSSPTTTRVSVSSSGGQGNGGSEGPSISANGRFVAFASLASALVAGDSNGRSDVFVRDRKTGVTKRVSVSSSGAQGNGDSSGSPVTISNDGRYVAFESQATNLVPGDGNNASDIFVRDTKLHTTTRVSVSQTGQQANAESHEAVISGDGGSVAFRSHASNLVPGDNFISDIFVRNLNTHTTTRVSVSTSGHGGNDYSQSPSISANGKIVAFTSASSNLVSGDTTGNDVFLHNMSSHETKLVSVGPSGVRGNEASFLPSISGDGRLVGFVSVATNLVGNDTNHTADVFVRDTKNHATNRISVSSSGAQGNGASRSVDLSAHGEFVVFSANADNLVANDTNHSEDAFIRDVANHKTRLLSQSSAGVRGNDASTTPAITPNGRNVAFSSNASSLVANDSNTKTDIFVRGPLFP